MCIMREWGEGEGVGVWGKGEGVRVWGEGEGNNRYLFKFF